MLLFFFSFFQSFYSDQCASTFSSRFETTADGIEFFVCVTIDSFQTFPRVGKVIVKYCFESLSKASFESFADNLLFSCLFARCDCLYILPLARPDPASYPQSLAVSFSPHLGDTVPAKPSVGYKHSCPAESCVKRNSQPMPRP